MFKFQKNNNTCYCKKGSCTCNNCCNKETHCGCKIELDANCVRYTDSALPCTDVKEGDRLESVIQKIEDKICELLNKSECAAITDNVIYDGSGIDCDTETAVVTGENLTEILEDIYSRLCALNTDNLTYEGIDIECDAETAVATGDSLTTILEDIYTRLCEVETPTTQGDFSVGFTNANLTGAYNLIDEETWVALGQTAGVTPPDNIFDFSLAVSGNIAISDSQFIFYNNNCFDDFEITINSLTTEPIEFPSGTTLNIPHTITIFLVDIAMTTISPPIGLYEFEIVFSTPNCGSRTFRVGFNVTA